MKTTVSTKGQIILPAEIRQREGIESGQVFEVERIDRGEYRLKRKERRRNEGFRVAPTQGDEKCANLVTSGLGLHCRQAPPVLFYLRQSLGVLPSQAEPGNEKMSTAPEGKRRCGN